MAAPSTVYQTYKTRRRKAGTPVVDVDLYIAKFLQNTTPKSGDNWGDGYFNSTDTEQDKIDKIKGIFKIDGWNQVDYAQQKTGTITISGTSVTGTGTAFTTDFVVGQKLGALVLTDGVLKCVETYIITAITSATAMSVVAGTNRTGISYALYHQGFIGYCNSRISGNGLYHKTERFSGVRVPTSVNTTAELLNDAGLNRMPVSTALTDNQVYWYNWISVKIYVRSDFYNSTTSYGYRYRINSGAWNVVTISSTGIAPKVSITEEGRGLLLNSVVEGATFEVQAWATNAEGTTYSNTITQTLDEELVVKDYDRFSAPNNPAETPVQTTIYIPRSKYDLLSTVTTNTTNTGIYFYIQDLCTSAVKAPSAYYTDFTDKVDVGGVLKYKMYYTDSNGQVVKYETRDIPANPKIRLTLDWLFDMEMKKIWYANFDLLKVTTNLTTYTITGTVVQRNSLGNIVNSNIASVSGTISSGTFGGFDEIGELTLYCISRRLLYY